MHQFDQPMDGRFDGGSNGRADGRVGKKREERMIVSEIIYMAIPFCARMGRVSDRRTEGRTFRQSGIEMHCTKKKWRVEGNNKRQKKSQE